MTSILWRRIVNYILAADSDSVKKRDPKRERLAEHGVLNRGASRVSAPWFLSGDFFDPQDLIQTKYEMLRYASSGDASKAEAAKLFGVSRPTYYQTEAAFARDGLAGLAPKVRGPKSAHKLTAPVMRFIERHLQEGSPIKARALCIQIQAELGLLVHPRSIERAIARKKKRQNSKR